MFAFAFMFVSVLCVATLCFGLAIVAFGFILNAGERGDWCKSRDNVRSAEDAHAAALRSAFAEMRKLGRVRGANARIAYVSFVRGDSPSLAIAPWIQVTPALSRAQALTAAMYASARAAHRHVDLARRYRTLGSFVQARAMLAIASKHVARAEDIRTGRMG